MCDPHVPACFVWSLELHLFCCLIHPLQYLGLTFTVYHKHGEVGLSSLNRFLLLGRDQAWQPSPKLSLSSSFFWLLYSSQKLTSRLVSKDSSPEPQTQVWIWTAGLSVSVKSTILGLKRRSVKVRLCSRCS